MPQGEFSASARGDAVHQVPLQAELVDEAVARARDVVLFRRSSCIANVTNSLPSNTCTLNGA